MQNIDLIDELLGINRVYKTNTFKGGIRVKKIINALSISLILLILIASTISFISSWGATAESVSFSKPYFSLSIGETLQLSLITVSNKPIGIKSLKVTTGNSLVSVDGKFLVKALKPGYSQIEATATNGSKAQASIIVYEGLITNVYKIALTINETYPLTLHSKNMKPLISPITFSSSDSSIASVNESGIINALSPGITSIIASTEQDSLMISVGVFSVDDPSKQIYSSIDSLTLEAYNIYTDKGNLLEANPTRPVFPILLDNNLTVLANQVMMKSSAPDILTVINKGYEYNSLIAKKAGKVTLTITANGFSKEFPLTVSSEPKIKALKVIKKDSNYTVVDWTRIKIGLPMTLTLQVSYIDGSIRELMSDSEGVIWKSSDSSVCKIEHHTLIGLKEGDVTISCTYKGQVVKFPMKIVKSH